MAGLARDLKSQDSPARAIDHLVQAAAELVTGCDAASVSLASRRGEITTSGATTNALTRADQLQMDLREGPCFDAVWEQQLIRVSDLRTETRWPHWAPRTIDELGFLSMVSVRLFTHESRVGALNLFAYDSRAFTDDDVDEAIAIAAHAAVAVSAANQIATLTSALDSRTVIGQATGLMMATYGLTAAQGFQVLRRLSMDQNRKLALIAGDVVAEHERDQAVPRTQPTKPSVNPKPGPFIGSRESDDSP